MIGSYTAKNNLAAVGPIVILGIPCFEIAVTMAARWRRGIPVWRGSPDHVVKRLQRAGMSGRASTAASCAASLVLGGVAVVIMRLDIETAMIAVGALALVALAAATLILRIKVDWQPGENK
jgi:UDP-GlcNAc:undecaprenyl-phosphate GlcNAc-1-phosphate transferase